MIFTVLGARIVLDALLFGSAILIALLAASIYLVKLRAAGRREWTATAEKPARSLKSAQLSTK